MPLRSGFSQATIGENIATEKRAHPSMDVKQAAAIAYSKARGDAAEDLDNDFAAKLDGMLENVAKMKAACDAVLPRLGPHIDGLIARQGCK